VKAVQVTRFGGPEVLAVTELANPEPISTEVLVRVLAAGVNPVDCKTRRGQGVARWVGPPPFVPGWDVAGVVESVGYGVTRFEVGDSVYGMPRFPRAAGGYAELVTAPALQLAKTPATLSATEAAAVPLAALTAWQCLVDAAGVKRGTKVLVHGARGGVGHIAVQIAKSRGAQVLTTSRRQRHALDERDLDVALDLVGGADTMRTLDTLHDGGLLLAVADGAPDDVKKAAARRGVRVLEPLVEPDGRSLDDISRLIESGELTVNVEEVFPLAQAARAHEALETGGRKGKLVLSVARHD
jgi:NADPH:quinone reductase-like Zn-dependent oxidoreductase